MLVFLPMILSSLSTPFWSSMVRRNRWALSATTQWSLFKMPPWNVHLGLCKVSFSMYLLFYLISELFCCLINEGVSTRDAEFCPFQNLSFSHVKKAGNFLSTVELRKIERFLLEVPISSTMENDLIASRSTENFQIFEDFSKTSKFHNTWQSIRYILLLD